MTEGPKAGILICQSFLLASLLHGNDQKDELQHGRCLTAIFQISLNDLPTFIFPSLLT